MICPLSRNDDLVDIDDIPILIREGICDHHIEILIFRIGKAALQKELVGIDHQDVLSAVLHDQFIDQDLVIVGRTDAVHIQKSVRSEYCDIETHLLDRIQYEHPQCPVSGTGIFSSQQNDLI